MPALRLKDVNKIYPGGVQAVFDFTIEIEPGEFIVLVGPSGCGKSTVLRMIAGLETISSGDMYLGEQRINDVAPADRDISMVFQNYALYGHMSVYQNIGFSQIIQHESSDTIHENVMKAAGIVKLKEQLNRFPRNLSGGQRQRVALGRSIVSSANIILMDEPLSNLDAKLRMQSRRELKSLHYQLGSTFIYVTHDQTEALTMADRIVVIDGGRIQQIGTPQEVYHQPENMFVGGFIGSPPMNFIYGEIKDSQFIAPGINVKVPQGKLNQEDMQSGRGIVLGIRAEHFSLEPNKTSASICTKITQQEFLGDISLVHFKIVDTDGVASLKQHLTQGIGDTIELYLDMNWTHFYDAETENCLYRGEGIS